MLLSLTLVSSADTLNLSTAKQYQLDCMRKLIGMPFPNENDESSLWKLNLYNAAEQTRAPCHWEGVTCRDDAITGINWKHESPRIVQNIAWLPPTLEDFELWAANLNCEIDTRLLPRTLHTFRATRCGIQGHMELRTLPHHMSELKCRDNAISGDIHLTHLPETMVCMDFSQNKIRNAIVDFERLPGGFKYIDLYRMGRRFDVVVLGGGTVDPRIRTKVEGMGSDSKRIAHNVGK